MKIGFDFYQKSALTVAPALLGKILVRKTKEGITKGRIVETEAYIGSMDKAAHSYGYLRSARTEIQYGPGGTAYVYLIYGMHSCMNIVTGDINQPEVVLLRALEPMEGIPLMQKRRKQSNIMLLCNGPGKLCQAMDITRQQYGESLLGDSLFLEDAPALLPEQIVSSKRINIDYAEEAKDFLWRYTIANNSFVSDAKKTSTHRRKK